MKTDKYIARSGYCSRRKACELIEEKRVLVNGKTANFSIEIKEGDLVLIDGKKLEVKPFVPVYIAYNKPKGIVCTTEKTDGNIIEAINHSEKIYPVGRLDKNSEGLILLTNHGELIDKIANASYGHEKEYLVTLNLPVRKQFLNEITSGMLLGDEKTKPCKASIEPGTKRVFRITLTQGLNRQIRRMCTACDYQVIKLQRLRVMNISLGKLKPGEWRDLTKEELEGLLADLK
ncbi:MAG TPA: pseudouridine synthase [Bacteroidia bacterium]|nr:pseudouridine synthase [Bacteroidia bacterium]